MRKLCTEILSDLKGKTLVTAESLTGGGIGAALTAIPGSSAVYMGGVVCYTNWVKEHILGVPSVVLETYGAVSTQTAEAMAQGARKLLRADIAVSVTGLAGPDGDDFGNPVGMVCVGYSDADKTVSETFYFAGDREMIRQQTIRSALELVQKQQKGTPR